MMRDLDEHLSPPTTEGCPVAARGRQRERVDRRHHRAPGVTARAHRATVLHYDADSEAIATVDADFRCEWVVPRGSVD